MSGHIFFNDNWYGFDDALFSSLRIIEIISEQKKSSSEIFTIDPIKFKISQNIKKSFDPKRIFNPGKMYTGI